DSQRNTDHAKDGVEIRHTPVSSPLCRPVRLEDRSLYRHCDKFSSAFFLFRRPRKRRVKVPAQPSEPRHSKPKQCGCLEGRTETKRQLIGDYRILTVLR